MGYGLRVDDGAEGARWELALQVLREGGVTVSIGELQLRRDTIGPLADGRVEIAVLTTRGPDQLTLQIAQHEVERGRRQFDALCT